LIGLLALRAIARAQQSCVEEITSQQADKASQTHPYVPSKVEARVMRIEKALSTDPRGLYPWIGSVFHGGLLAAGPGFRMPFGGGAIFDAQAAMSVKKYKLARATVMLPSLMDRHVSLAFQTQLIDATKIGFYGIGQSTQKSDRSTFLYRPASIGTSLVVKPIAPLQFGASAMFLDIHTGRGESGIAAEDRFDPAVVPGLGVDTKYVVTQVSAAMDWRDSPGYSRRGGLYKVAVSSYDQRAGNAFGFRRVDVDAQQLFPILRANWVIALRASVSTTSTDAGAEVPYYLMPMLGGGSDLRGFATGRFRDLHRALFTAEYRWTPAHFVDMAIFHDAGKVTPRREELNIHGLRHTNGIGIRIHTPAATFLRLEYAHGDEGGRIIMTFGPIF